MITKNFIKQCEKAEEIQKWYKRNKKNVNEGDRYICRCDTCKDNTKSGCGFFINGECINYKEKKKK